MKGRERIGICICREESQSALVFGPQRGPMGKAGEKGSKGPGCYENIRLRTWLCAKWERPRVRELLE
jgi:hypothetical protein